MAMRISGVSTISTLFVAIIGLACWITIAEAVVHTDVTRTKDTRNGVTCKVTEKLPAQREVVMNGVGNGSAGAHGEDNGSLPRNDIAASPNSFFCGLTGFRLCNYVASSV